MTFRLISAVALVAVAGIGGCGGGQNEIDLAMCEDVARAAHASAADFKTLSTSKNQTSEGISVLLTVSYNEAGQEQTARHRCWFDTNNNHRLASFSSEKDGQFENVPKEQLEAFISEVRKKKS